MSEPFDVFIHAGMFKTGTTAFQRMMKRQSHVALQHGIFYPGRWANHSGFLNPRIRGWSADPLRALVAEAQEAGAHCLAMSGEAVTILSPDEIAALTAGFGNCRVHYVFGLRHWVDYLPSRWAQYIVRRDSQCFRVYLDRVRSEFAAHVDLRFDLLLERFRPQGASLRVFSYSNARALGQPPLADLMRAMGIGKKAAAALRQAETRANTRLPWQEVERLRLLNGVTAAALGLNQDDICDAIGGFGYGNVPFVLAPALDQLPAALLEPMDAAIAAAEAAVTLDSSMSWIADLQDRTEAAAEGLTVNPLNGRLFGAPTRSETMCTDLHWSAFDTAGLRAALLALPQVEDARLQAAKLP